MIAFLIAIVIMATIVALYLVYDPFLDIVEMSTHRHLVLWYRSPLTRTGRDYKRLFRVR